MIVDIERGTCGKKAFTQFFTLLVRVVAGRVCAPDRLGFAERASSGAAGTGSLVAGRGVRTWWPRFAVRAPSGAASTGSNGAAHGRLGFAVEAVHES